MKASDINSAIKAGAILAGVYFLTSAFFGRKKRQLEEDREYLTDEPTKRGDLYEREDINDPETEEESFVPWNNGKIHVLNDSRMLNQNTTDKLVIQGIGALKPKRRIWHEVEAAQNQGIDLTDPNGWQGKEKILLRLANGKLSRSNSSKPDEERYFNQLRRAYKSIAGTGLPHDQSVVRNEHGDVILIYNDYHLDRLPHDAAAWVANESQENAITYEYGYWATVAAIAQGKKFVWKSQGVHRGIEQLVFGRSAPSERKQRISYLASPEKGGVYPERWAHALWEANDAQQDDQDITNGVLDAFRDTPSVGAAQQACIQMYMEAHQVTEPLLYEDTPF